MTENAHLEYKPSFNTDVIETAVAFANSSGGEIWIGVDNQGLATGAAFSQEVLRDVVNRIANATEPSLTVHAEFRGTSPQTMLILQVPEYPIKPVSTRGRCFKRAGSVNRQPTSPTFKSKSTKTVSASGAPADFPME